MARILLPQLSTDHWTVAHFPRKGAHFAKDSTRLVSGPSHVPIALQHAFQLLDTLRPGEPGHVIGFWMTVFGTQRQPILEGIGKIAGLFAAKITRVFAGHFAECRNISRKDR